MRLVDLLKKKDAKKGPSEEKAKGKKASEEEPAGEPEKEKPSRPAPPKETPREPEPSQGLSEDDQRPPDKAPPDNGAPPQTPADEEEPERRSLLTDAYLAKEEVKEDKPEKMEEGAPAEVPHEEHTTKVLGARDLYLKTLAAVRFVLEGVRADRLPDVSTLDEIVANLFAHGDPDKTIFMLAMEEQEEHYLVAHSLNVALYSLKLGGGLGYGMEKLKELTLAGLLHDVGLLKIPQEILDKESELTGREGEIVRQHPKLGYQIVGKLGPRFKNIAQVVLTHHERVDGTGYPQGLSGDAISEMGQVVGIAETYDTLISDRPYRKAIPPFDAVKIILEEERGKYTPKMLKLFLTEVSIFPINSLVRLNNQAVARVVALNKNLPLRPVVEIIINPQGHHLEHKELLDLSRNPLIYIASSVSPEDVGIHGRV